MSLRRLVIFTRDLQRSVAFWGEAGVGLRTHVATGEHALLESNGVGFHLRQTYDEALLSTGYGPLLQLDVRNMDALVPRLLAAGASLDGAILHEPAGTVATLRAPDGPLVTLFEAHEPMA